MTDLYGKGEDGAALQFVKEQTEEICLAAVKQNGSTLQFVEPEEICITAINQNPNAIQYMNIPLTTNIAKTLIANKNQLKKEITTPPELTELLANAGIPFIVEKQEEGYRL